MPARLTQEIADQRVHEMGLIKGYIARPFVYKNSKTLVTVDCTACEAKCPVTYNSLMNRKQKHCKICGGREKLTQEIAEERLFSAGLVKGFTVRSFVYKNTRMKIPIDCNSCGSELNVKFSTLTTPTKGHCGVCKRRLKITQKVAEADVRAAGIVKGFTARSFIYGGSNTKIPLDCDTCKAYCEVKFNGLVNSDAGHCYDCGRKAAGVKQPGHYNSTTRERDAEEWKQTPAYVYLISFMIHDKLVYKIGISADDGGRYNYYLNKGATGIFKISMDLYSAHIMEENVLAEVDQYLIDAHDPDYPFKGGHTECFLPTVHNLKQTSVQ